MKPLPPSIAASWHAHVYFDTASRNAAWALRGLIDVELSGRFEMGPLLEKSVGRHSIWTYRLAFTASNFAHVVG